MTRPATPARLDAVLDRLYAARFSPAERRRRAELWRTLCDGFFNRYVQPDATVLDLGAGYCDFINHVRATRRIAIDLNPETPEAAQPGVTVHALPMQALGSVIAPSSVDLAFASNVFEHLRSPDALLEVLRAIFTALRPGGRLIVMQPNVRALGARFWDFFDHTLPLSDRGMTEALTLSGYVVTECRARFLPYTTKSRLPHSALLVRAYLAFRPAQWLLGKQMLVVATRPA
jgi:SAM-dependent methyltransferase